MIDLNKIINESLADIEKSGFVKETVDKAVKEAIGSVVTNVFSYRSPLRDQLEKYISNNLNVNLDELNITGYNTLVLKAVQEHLDRTLKVQGIDKLKERMNYMLSNAKAEYTLSEIVKELKNDEFIDFEDDEITLIIDNDNSFVHIYMDPQEGVSKYSCAYKISMNKNEVYTIKLGNKSVTTKDILANFIGFEDFLFKIYAAGSKIILDKGNYSDDYDLEIQREYED